MSDIDKSKGESEKDAEREAEIALRKHFIEELENVIPENLTQDGSILEEIKIEFTLPIDAIETIEKRMSSEGGLEYINKVLGMKIASFGRSYPDKIRIGLFLRTAEQFVIVRLLRKEVEKAMEMGNDPVEVKLELPGQINEKIKSELRFDKEFIANLLGAKINIIAFQVFPNETAIIIKLSREEAQKIIE